jgi:predicted RNase H-like HicB family nuclease
MITYPALFEYDEEEKVYNVRFPDLPGCFTYGETIDEAKAMAKEALTGFLQSVDARKMRLPDPPKLEGDETAYFDPETPAVFAICLRKQLKVLRLSHSTQPKSSIENIPVTCRAARSLLENIPRDIITVTNAERLP